MNSLREIILNLSLGKQQFLVGKNQLPIISCVRFYRSQKHEIPTPKPGNGKQYRRYNFCIGYVQKLLLNFVHFGFCFNL